MAGNKESLYQQFEGKTLRDFEEITLAIALLGGLLAFLLKLINYFNENIIYWNEFTQNHAYFLVGALILEFIIIFLFFISKGIVLSTNKRRIYLEGITAELFNAVFIYPFLWFVTTIQLILYYYVNQNIYTNTYMYIFYIFLIFFIDCILFVELMGKEKFKNALDRVSEEISRIEERFVFFLIILVSIIVSILPYWFDYINKNFILIINVYIYLGTVFLILNIDYILFVELTGKKELKNGLDRVSEKLTSINLKQLIVLIMVILIFFLTLKLYSDLFFVAPSILLMGSFSIEEFTQPIEKYDIITFTIKETGLTYSKNHISLNRLNAENNSLSESDSIILPIQNESKNKSMFGGLHDKGLWYININTSSLQAGNYMLHAEVTNDLSKNSTFGVFKKHADKLFYVASK